MSDAETRRYELFEDTDPDCIGCALGICGIDHQAEREETRAEQLGVDSWGDL